jgi:CheY-like chemotaxis protein
MDDSDPFAAPYRQPTATRPLLGLTILVVEDSRYASDAIRLMCLRSGARIRRADSLRAAHRHLQVYRPSVILVDMGLPDGSGADLIAELAATSPRIGVILGTSGDDGAEQMAMTAGADGFMTKPVTSLATFQATILSLLPADRHPAGPRVLHDETIRPDPMCYRDDMEHVVELLADETDEKVLAYIAQFVAGVARSADDMALANAAQELGSARRSGKPLTPSTARIAGLVQERLEARVAI